MIDKTDLDKLRKGMESFDEKREDLIRGSRNVVKTSKLLIYAIQRQDLIEAEKLVEQIRQEISALEKHVSGHSELRFSPAYKIAVQEFVEAMALYYFIKEKKLVTSSELNVDAESYLLGICDLTGELVRKAVNSAISRSFALAVEIKDFVSEIYGEMLKFNFRNGNLRKRFDSIKYNLKKLEDLVYDIKTKGLI